MTGAAAGIRGGVNTSSLLDKMLISNPKMGETEQAEAEHCGLFFSTMELRETASGLACTSHTVLVKL
jgi:hypothetical protein